MKKILFFLICCLLVQFHSFGQKDGYPIPRSSECQNYNSYLNDSMQLDIIRPFIVRITQEGTIILDPEKSGSIDDILQRTGLSPGTSFRLIRETSSRFDSSIFYRIFQQFYHDIEVTGGGYTTALVGPNHTNSNPCSQAYKLTTHVLSDIHIDPVPTIPRTALASILQIQEIQDAKLVVSHNLTGLCNYNLTWKVSYFNDGPKLSWVDAHSGNILLTIEAIQNHNAPTMTYGPQFLNDRTAGNVTSLESPDLRIRVFEFGNLLPAGPFDYPDILVPITFDPNNWTNEAPIAAYQAFWVTSEVVPLFASALDINFETVWVANTTVNNAGHLRTSPFLNPRIFFGIVGGRPTALFDVVAHELMHNFLNGFIDYDQGGNASLHEAICDMAGTFIESLIPMNNGVDWVIGDDEPNVAAVVGRDLENPVWNCFDDVRDFTWNQRHNRSTPLGHWYFLVSQGNQAENIPALGLLPALNIVLEALNGIGRNADYHDLMLATLDVVLDHFGRCSNEFYAVARAWELICVPTGYAVNGAVPPCLYTVTGPDQVCEESHKADFHVGGYVDPVGFRWRIIGDKSTEYRSYYGMTGNTQEGGQSLKLIEFPKYPYYPQYITIELFAISINGTQFVVRKRLKLMDCDKDDPTCEEYYGLNNLQATSVVWDEDPIDGEVQQTAYERVRVFDLMGRMIYQESTDDLKRYNIPYKGIVIIIYYDSNGKIVEIVKEHVSN